MNPSESREDLVRQLKRASWPTAIGNLRQEWARGGGEAARRAIEFADVYKDKRAAMVFDCVMSIQKSYRLVEGLVRRFQETPNAESLESLAEYGPGPEPLQGRWVRRAGTMQRVAAGLVRYCQDHRMADEEGVRQWAAEADAYEFTWNKEGYVGSVSGIGIATFAYLRMRCGANAIKPEVRVKQELGKLLFPLGDGSDYTVLCVANAAADEIGVRRLELDQLLWWLSEGAPVLAGD